MLASLQEKTNVYLHMKQEDLSGLQNPKQSMDDLIALLTQHNMLYYVKASPVIADSQYDYLFDLLKTLEQSYPDYISLSSPTQRLVGQIDGFQKSSHRVPLLSLMNTYSAEDIEARRKTLFNGLEKRGDGAYELSFCIEPKLDGNAVEVIYKDGLFISASTRGDGNEGEDITEHAKYLLGIPLQLHGDTIPTLLSLRGEIIMSKEAHKRLNDYQTQEGLPLFANPRNAVAGTLRNLDPKIVQYRGLTVIFYDVLYAESMNFESQSEMYKQLQVLGLPVIDKISVVQSSFEIQEICNDPRIVKDLEQQWYETDGLVIKVDNIAVRAILGTTHHHPRWAMAYKFPSKQVVTKLLSISYQIGRTGVVTPVAELEPVSLGGVTIARASLHNFEQIEKLDLRIGDSVWVQRSGEVIPYVLGSVIELRDGSQKTLEPPLCCPVCNGLLVKDESFVALCCVNIHCPAIIKESLIHAVSKHCLDISGLGESLIVLLVDVGLLKNIGDLFLLSSPSYKMQLRLLPGLADKKILQILQAIETTKMLPFWRWLHAFGIDGVGIKTAQELEQWLAQQGCIGAKAILDVFSEFQSSEIHGFGKELQSVLHIYAKLEYIRTLRCDLEVSGVVFHPLLSQNKQGILSGKNIVITGTFDIPRSQLIRRIEEEGGKVVEGVSKKVYAVLVGQDAGSKLQQAEKLYLPMYVNFDDLVNSFSR